MTTAPVYCWRCRTRPVHGTHQGEHAHACCVIHNIQPPQRCPACEAADTLRTEHTRRARTNRTRKAAA